MAELKTEVENMGASNEQICQEILEGQFDGVNFPSFNSHGKIFYHTYSTLLVGFSVYLDW